MKTIKRIFIPFYWARETEYFESDNPAPILWGVTVLTYMVIRFSIGYNGANNLNKCIIRSIGDFLITPMYALGCNVGKNRFEIKVN